MSLEDCAKTCRDNKKCKSFEHSIYDNHCALNSAEHPNSPQKREYVFCSKIGKNRSSLFNEPNTFCSNYKTSNFIYVNHYFQHTKLVDCEWKPYVKFNSTCSTTCGSGTITWIREKAIEQSNGGFCNNSLGFGTEECYDCKEIGTNIY